MANKKKSLKRRIKELESRLYVQDRLISNFQREMDLILTDKYKGRTAIVIDEGKRKKIKILIAYLKHEEIYITSVMRDPNPFKSNSYKLKDCIIK